MTEPKSESKAGCGAHTELAKNAGARITRCECGTVHVHVPRSGISVQLSEEQFQELGDAIASARGAIRPTVVANPAGASPRGTGEFVSIQVLSEIPAKKRTFN